MSSTTELIKKLRDMTQAGVLDAMKALKECNNDLDKAAQWLREKGIAKASKKAGAIVTEGVVEAIAKDDYAAIVEINSQTDFVANNEGFKKLVWEVAEAIRNINPRTLQELENAKLSSGMTVKDQCIDLTAKTGEKIAVRRLGILTKATDQIFQVYQHFNNKIAVIIKLSNTPKNPECAKDIAMHIAAMNPKFIAISDADPEWIKNETEILRKQTIAEGKPIERVEMIVKGRINKSIAEVCLEEQKLIKDPTKTVKTYLNENNTKVLAFIRYEVGEGVEKKVSNFADEVAQQMGK